MFFAKAFSFYLAPFFLESKSKDFSKGWTSANQNKTMNDHDLQ